MSAEPEGRPPPHRRTYTEALAALVFAVRHVGDATLMLLGDTVGDILGHDGPPVPVDTLFDAIRADAHAIEEECLELLARQQPVARDLRGILAALRTVEGLEHSAALAVELADHAPEGFREGLPAGLLELLELMAGQASVELSLALDAYTDGDAALAGALRDMDDVMDNLQRDLFRGLARVATVDAEELADVVHVVFAARICERIGDTAVVIADRVTFWVTGEIPTEDRPPDSDDVVAIDG